MEHHNVESIDAEYLDCCLPDYFQGSNAEEVLAVPVHANITWREARTAIDDTFHASSGWFDSVAGSGGMLDDALVELFKPVINKMDNPCDFVSNIEDDNNDCYLYIALRAR